MHRCYYFGERVCVAKIQRASLFIEVPHVCIQGSAIATCTVGTTMAVNGPLRCMYSIGTCDPMQF